MHAFLASSLVKCFPFSSCTFLQRFSNCITITSNSFFLSRLHYHQMGRPPCCDKTNVKRGLWTAEEDAKILAHVSSHGIGNWTLVPRRAGLNRCGKSCRLRWTNYLRPDLKHDTFTPQEEDHIIKLHKAIGSRWSLIAKQLPGRTDNDVKNYWNTKLRKKLAKMGIDPVTHKPFSQILSDYGNINTGLQTTSSTVTRIGSLSKLSTSSHNNYNNNNVSIQITEPMTDDFQNTKSFLTNNQHSWPYFYNEVPSPSSSSSSSSSCTVNRLSYPQPYLSQPSPFQVIPPVPAPAPAPFSPPPSTFFSWSDFLVSEPAAAKFSTDMQLIKKQELPPLPQCNFASETNSHFEAAASSTSVKSFVEVILDQDSQMQSEFSHLLDESFHY